MQKIDLLGKFTPAAHRGASRQYPENTIEAFRRALKIMPGCLLEIDVRQTCEGDIVVFHDALLNSQTDGEGPVRSVSLTEIKKLDAGYGISFDCGATYPFRGKGHRIAALAEALDFFPATAISIDIKDNSFEAAAAVVTLIGKKKSDDSVIIGSFHARVLRFVRDNYPHIMTSFSKWDVIRFLLLHWFGLSGFFRCRGRAMFIPEYAGAGSPEYQAGRLWQGIRIVSPRFIRDAHRAGVPVIVWTVDNIDNMRRLVSWGVDGIVTDYPDLLKKVMAEKGLIKNDRVAKKR